MKTDTIRPNLIVTRHPALVAYLIEQGIATPETRVIEHATTKDVARRHVLGILPHHLSSQAASITEIPMRTSIEDRQAMQAGDLTLGRLREIAGEPVTYHVQRIGSARRPGLAWAAAYEYAEGYGPASIHKSHEWRGLEVFELIDVTQQLGAYVLPERGVWRPATLAPEQLDEHGWLDGLGRPVDAGEIGPSPSWGYRLRPARLPDAREPYTEYGMPVGTHGHRRWATPGEAEAAGRALALDIDLHVVAGAEHGRDAKVHATITAPAAVL